MIVPDGEMRRDVAGGRRPGRTPRTAPTDGIGAPRDGGAHEPWTPGQWLLLAVLLSVLGWFGWVYGEIRHYAGMDQARRADAIAVFGAAEYDGHPSPVLRARLDQGLKLYREGLAPYVITLGGGGDPHYSEGGVGAQYLRARGVPESQVIAETQSSNTEESAQRLAVIARENGFQTLDAVSDGTHLFRIHALCASLGLTVYTSPRPAGRSVGAWEMYKRTTHEMLSYTGWRLHLH